MLALLQLRKMLHMRSLPRFVKTGQFLQILFMLFRGLLTVPLHFLVFCMHIGVVCLVSLHQLLLNVLVSRLQLQVTLAESLHLVGLVQALLVEVVAVDGHSR
jgi:hypothetical protein